jgi:hypothetical protein
MILWGPETPGSPDAKKLELWQLLPRFLRPESYRDGRQRSDGQDRRQYDRRIRQQFRREWGLAGEFTWLIEIDAMPAADYDTILRAFAVVLAQSPRSVLLLRADSSIEKDVCRLAIDLGIASRVRFPRSDADRSAFRNAADAMVIRTPGISTQTPRGNGYLASANSSRALADAMLWITSLPGSARHPVESQTGCRQRPDDTTPYFLVACIAAERRSTASSSNT